MAETEMVERVARAMCEADGFKWDASDFGETANGETPEDQRLYWRDKARAAIEAMRSPNPAMLAAAWRKISADKKAAGVAKLGPGPGCIEWWNAAIDAALSDTRDKG